MKNNEQLSSQSFELPVIPKLSDIDLKSHEKDSTMKEDIFDDSGIFPSAPGEMNHGFLYIEFTRLLSSKKCVYSYIFLITFSVVIFIYSILAYFFNLNEFPILLCESFLVVIISFDMMARIYVTGCNNYFRKRMNLFDIFLILLNFITLFMYMKFHNAAQEIEDISFALLIFIRNSSQMLRLVVLVKNQKITAKNIEEVINLSTLYETKRLEILSMKRGKKSDGAYSFVEDGGDNKKSNKIIQVMHMDFKENESELADNSNT